MMISIEISTIQQSNSGLIILRDIFKINFRSHSKTMGPCTSSDASKHLLMQIWPVQDLSSLDLFLKPHLYIYTPERTKLSPEDIQKWNDVVLKVISKNPQIKRAERLSDAEDDKTNFLVYGGLEETEDIPNYKAFQQIGFAFAGEQPQNLQQLKLKKQYGYRFGGLLSMDQHNITQYFERVCQLRQIYFCQSDIAPINRMWSVMNFFLGKDFQDSFLCFQRLFNKFGSGKEELKTFLEGRNQQKRLSFLINQFVNNHPVLNKMADVIKTTLNPEVIPYVSWFYNALQSYIQQQYANFLKDIKSMTVFVVVQLSPEQLSKMDVDKNFMFSTFRTGFIYAQEARKIKAQSQRNYLFKILIPKSLGESSLKVDNGFCVIEKKVLFSLCTFFKIKDISKNQREVQAVYGVLGDVFNERKNDFRYSNLPKITADDINLLKLYDNMKFSEMMLSRQRAVSIPQKNSMREGKYEAGTNEGNNQSNQEREWIQANLFFHLQMYHKYLSLKGENYRQSAVYKSFKQKSTNNSSNFSSPLNSIRLTTNGYQRIQGEVQYLRYFQSEMKEDLAIELHHSDIMGVYSSFRSREEIESMIHSNGFKGVVIRNYYALELLKNGEVDKAKQVLEQAIEQLKLQFQRRYGKHQQLHYESVYSFPLFYLLTRTKSILARQSVPPNVGYADALEKDFNSGCATFEGIYISWIPKDL